MIVYQYIGISYHIPEKKHKHILWKGHLRLSICHVLSTIYGIVTPKDLPLKHVFSEGVLERFDCIANLADLSSISEPSHCQFGALPLGEGQSV